MPDPADTPAAGAEVPESAEAPPPRALLWTMLLSLLFVVSLAFVLLVSQQMRQAEARRAAVQVQLAAFEDCLQFVQGSTIANCTARLGRQSAPAAAVDNALLDTTPSDATPPSGTPRQSIAVR